MIEIILQYLNNRQDKVIHFCGGYILATVFPILPTHGLLLSLIVGKAKEMYDFKHQDKHTYDKWDMFATWSGGVLGFMAMVIK